MGRGPWQPGNVCCAWSPWDVGSLDRVRRVLWEEIFGLADGSTRQVHSGSRAQSCQLKGNGSLFRTFRAVQGTGCRAASVAYTGSQPSRRPFSAAGLCYTHRHRKRRHSLFPSQQGREVQTSRRRPCLALSVHILGNGGRHLLHSTWTATRRYGQTGARALPRNLGTHLLAPRPMYSSVSHAVPTSVPHRTVGPQTRQGRETAARPLQGKYLRID